MKSVSADFLTAAVATVRKASAFVEITWTDPFIDPTIQVSSNDDNRITWNSQAADLVEASGAKWAQLDGSFLLDGTISLCPQTQEDANVWQTGWRGATLADGSGNFSAPYPALTMEFTARPVSSYLVVGDDQFNEYPVDFTIDIYEDATLVQTVTVAGNTSLRKTAYLTTPALAATKVVLTITKWSAAGKAAKILEFYTSISEIYQGDEIVSLNLLEESEVKDGSLPIGNISSNELDLELQNIKLTLGSTIIRDPFFYRNADSPYNLLIKKNRKISPWLGLQLPDASFEWVNLGTFWSGDWSMSEQDGRVSVSCRDRMEMLKKATFECQEIYEDATLYTIAEAVLTDAKNSIPMLDLEWTIDASLSNYQIPYAYFGKMSYFEAIRDIVTACMGRAYMSKDDILIVEGPPDVDYDSTDLVITQDNYFKRSLPAKSEELVNSVDIEVKALLPKSTTVQIYKSSEDFSIEASGNVTLDIKYSFPQNCVAAFTAGVTVTPTGDGTVSVSVTAAAYYAWGATLTITNSVASAGTFSLLVEGTCLEIVGAEVITVENESSIVENGLLKYDFPSTPLMQSKAVAESVGQALIDAFAQPRKDVSLEWRGNPALELGDVVDLPIYNKYSQGVYGLYRVFRNELSFDGTLRGRVEGRIVGEYESAYAALQNTAIRNSESASAAFATYSSGYTNYNFVIHNGALYACAYPYPTAWTGQVRSSTNGQTWQTVGTTVSGMVPTSLSVAPNGDLYMAGITSALATVAYKSTNSGGTWTEIYRLTESTGHRPAIRAVDDSTIVIIIGSTATPGTANEYVVRSTNGGGSWTTVFSQLATSISYVKGGISYVNGVLLGGTTSGGRVFRSADDGATWSIVTAGVAAVGKFFLYLDGKILGAISAADGTISIKQSTDLGQTWTYRTSVLGTTPFGLYQTEQGGVILVTNESSTNRMYHLVDHAKDNWALLATYTLSGVSNGATLYNNRFIVSAGTGTILYADVNGGTQQEFQNTAESQSISLNEY